MKWKNLLPNISLRNRIDKSRNNKWEKKKKHLTDWCDALMLLRRTRWSVPCIQDMWVVMLRLMILTLKLAVLPIIRSDDSPIKWHPNLWLAAPETLLPSTLPTLEIRFYCQLCIHNCSDQVKHVGSHNETIKRGVNCHRDGWSQNWNHTNAHRLDLNRLPLV